MRKINIKISFLFISMIMYLCLTSCIKDTYNMSMFSKKGHLSPTLDISAVKGDVSFSDVVKSNDTVIFDKDKLVILVFKKDSVVDLKMSDFSKGTVLKTATIAPSSYDLNIGNILDHITGEYRFLNPSIKFNYTNSFPDPLKISLNVTGTGKGKTVALNLASFTLSKPTIPGQHEISASYVIDKNNSNLPDVISLPPETINYSGSAVITSTVKDSQAENYALSSNHLTGSLEIDVPLDLTLNNLQLIDTIDNFIKDKNNNDPLNPESFQLLRINITAKNGFPLGVGMKMSLYNSSTNSLLSTIDATGLLNPAPVDSNGKADGVGETSTSIEFTKDFLSNVNKADKIIFRFTLNATGNVTQEIKIYSDYRINFQAVLVVKPDIKLNL